MVRVGVSSAGENSVQENWQKNVSFTTDSGTSLFTTVLKHMLKLKHHFGSKIKDT